MQGDNTEPEGEELRAWLHAEAANGRKSAVDAVERMAADPGMPPSEAMFHAVDAALDRNQERLEALARDLAELEEIRREQAAALDQIAQLMETASAVIRGAIGPPSNGQH